VESLFGDIQYKRDAGASESTVYWDSLKNIDSLREDLQESLAFNSPPGERSVEEASAKDRWELLKRLEDPARIRNRLACVKAPEENARPSSFDIGPFYRAVGLLPGTNPLRKGAFEVPPGCRTVTQRESGAQLIFRSISGQGRVVAGGEEKPLTYEYVTVPPETPYLIENPGGDPLNVEFIVINP
jgi:hypothetical protein